MSDTPIWLMDVDGPLNIIQPRMPEGARLFIAGNGFRIMYKPDITKRLAILHEQGRVELQWLTTWEDLADLHLAKEMGLPRDLKVSGISSEPGENFWWKHNVVARLLADGNRIIWTDDDISTVEVDAFEWLKEQDPARIIWDSPDDTVGITHEFIDRVEAWL